MKKRSYTRLAFSEELNVLESCFARFHEDARVQRALSDYHYLTHDFLQECSCAEYHPPHAEHSFTGSTKLIDTATALYAATNQTQKDIARRGHFQGMIATSTMAETLGLLVKNTHTEFQTTRSIVQSIQFTEPLFDSKQRIRLYGCLIVEAIERVTSGKYTLAYDGNTPVITNVTTKIAHGIFLLFRRNIIAGSMQKPVRQYYSYGLTNTQHSEVWNHEYNARQGHDFRCLEMYEFGLQHAKRTSVVKKPYDTHLIETEVAGKKLIQAGHRPTFFTRQASIFKGYGPKKDGVDGVDCSKEMAIVSQQIENNIDCIAATLFPQYYPECYQ